MSNQTLQQQNQLLAALAAAAPQPFDPSPPATTQVVVDSLVDNKGPQTGNIAENGLTDDLRPVLSGHIDGGAGLALKVWFNSVEFATITADDNGNWSYTPSVNLLVNQEYYAQVSIQDPGSDKELMSLPFHFFTTEAGQDSAPAPLAATDVTLTDDVKGGIVGLLHNTDVTNDSTPTFAGRAAAGDTVLVMDKGVIIGSTTTASNGNWTFTPKALDDGYHSFTAVVQDPKTGLESASTLAIAFTVDTMAAPPVITGAWDDVGLQQGFVSNGGKTDDQHPTFTGTAEGSATVYVYMKGVNGLTHLLGSTVADSHGDWSFYDAAGIPGARITGSHPFWAVQVDEAGNRSGNSNTYSLNITGSNQDLVNPDAATNIQVYDDAGAKQGYLKSGDTTDDSTPTISGKATPDDIVIISNGSSVLGSTTVAKDGSWSFTPKALPDGKYSITAVVQNPSTGAKSPATAAFAFTLDTHATTPVITGIFDDVGVKQGLVDNGGLTDDKQPQIQGTGAPGGTVTLTMYGPVAHKTYTIAKVVVGADGHWSYTFAGGQALQSGSNVFHVTQTDVNGNTLAGSDYAVTLVGSNQDNTSTPNAATDVILTDNVPGGIVGQLHNGDITNDNHAVLSGKATAGDTVIISDNGKVLGSVTVAANGTWSFKPATALADGNHSFTTVVQDPANGHSSAATSAISVTVDTHATTPVITGIYDDVGVKQGLVANGGLTDDTQPTLKGTGEPGSTVTVYMHSQITGKDYTLGNVIADKSGNWSYTLQGGSVLRLGETATFHVVSTDIAGNQASSADYIVKEVASNQDDTSTPNAATDVILTDNVPGGIVGQLHNGDITNDNHAVLSGKATAGDIVIVSDAGKVIGSTTVASNGTWSYKPAVALADGKHSFTAVVQDPANGHNSPATSAISVTVDTHATTPVITAAYDDVGVKQGLVENGGLTDDSQLKITGTAEAGSLVFISHVIEATGARYVDGSTLADASGHWTYQMYPESFQTSIYGNRIITATATDVAGNSSANSNPYVVNFVASNQDDTSAPAASTNVQLYDDYGNVQGYIHNGDTTDDTTPIMSGNAAAGNVVIVSDNGQVIGSTIVSGNGTWSFTPAKALTDGKHSFTSVVENPNNHHDSAASAAINFTVATGAPHIADNSFHFDEGLHGNSDIALTWTGSFSMNAMPGVLTFDEDNPLFIASNDTYGSDIHGQFKHGVVDTVTLSASVWNWPEGTHLLPSQVTFYDANGKVIPTASIGVYNHPDNGNQSTVLETDFIAKDGYSIAGFTVHNAIYFGGIHWSSETVNHSYSSAHMLTSSATEASEGDAVMNISATTGHTLQLSVDDVLSHAQQNVLIPDGHQQLVVTGNAGDTLELKVVDLNAHEWQSAGSVTSGGVQYDSYHHAGDNLELLVQHGVELHQTA